MNRSDKMNFKKYKISDVGSVITGKTPPTKNEEYFSVEKDKYLFITPRDMNINSKYISETERYLTDFVTDKFSSLIIDNKSICVSCIGTVGKVFIPKQLSITNQQINSITNLKDFCNFDYLYYYLKQNYKKIQSVAGGTTMPIVNKSSFEGIEIELPSLSDQLKIVKILNKIDVKIELNNKINNNLEEQLRLLFEENILKKLDDENTYECSLYDQFDVIDNRGKTPPLVEYSKYPIIDVKVLSGTGRVINYNNCLKYVDKETYDTFFRSGHPKLYDTLLSTVGSLAELKIYLENIGTIAQNVVALRPKNDYPLFMYQYILSLRQRLTSYDIGSVQPSIKVTQFMKEIIKIPKDKELIYKFENLATANTLKMENLMKENRYLEQLRDTLLPKLMNGEVSMNGIDVS